eukprot:Hpha_TRINITY_DN16384_c2_g3::TRINITY_DN16384_c2_g3_i1::g.62943::m.62943
MRGCYWLVRPGDNPDEARIKTVMFPFALFISFASLFIIINQLQTDKQMVNIVGLSISTFAFALFMVGILLNAAPAGYLLDFMLTLTTCGTCLLDIGLATRSSPFRSWAFVVIALDITLVFKRFHMPRFIIPFVLVQHAAFQVEPVSRFG